MDDYKPMEGCPIEKVCDSWDGTYFYSDQYVEWLESKVRELREQLSYMNARCPTL